MHGYLLFIIYSSTYIAFIIKASMLRSTANSSKHDQSNR